MGRTSRKSWVSLLVSCSFVALLFAAGCRCEVRIGTRNRSKDTAPGAQGAGGHVPLEREARRAAQALHEGKAAEAVDILLAGISRWTRRARYRFVRTAQYTRVLHEAVLSKNGLARFVERCLKADTALLQRVCGLFLEDHFERAASEPRYVESAKKLFEELCLDSEADLYTRACGRLPSAVAATLAESLSRALRAQCLGSHPKRDWCKVMGRVAWAAGLVKWDLDLLAAAGDALVRNAPDTGLALMLEASFLRGPQPKEVTQLARSLLLRVLGSPDGLKALRGVLTDQFSDDQRTRIVAAGVEELRGHEAEVAAALDLLEAQEVDRLLALAAASGREGRRLARAVRKALRRTGGRMAVESYVATGRGGRKALAGVVSYLRSHPGLLEELILSRMASLPPGPRRRALEIVRRIRPDATYGGVTGLVEGVGSARTCMVMLRPAAMCTPTPRLPTGRGKARVVFTTRRGGFEIRRLAVGPYHMWVRCRSRRWVPISKFTMRGGDTKSVERTCPVVVLPGTMITLPAVSLEEPPTLAKGQLTTWLGGPASVPK